MKRDNPKKSILVISQYFYPEQFRINDICTEWVKRGYKVKVLTGIPNYPQGKYFQGYGLFKKRKEIYQGIEINRIPIIPRGNNLMNLAFNYISFVVSGYFWVLLSKMKADFLFIYEVSPMTQALPGIWFAKKSKIPCYLYVTDLWPESIETVAGVKNKYLLAVINKMVDYIYKRCDKIFTSSDRYIQEINDRGIPLDKLKFWPQYAEDYYVPLKKESVVRTEIPRDDVFNIIFAGNIGEAQGLRILPQAAHLLKKRKIKVRFNIVGDGRYKETLINLVKDEYVEDMFNFIKKQPSEKIPEFMAVCDASLICLAESDLFSKTLPAKVQSTLACGIPAIISADGEIQNIINEAKAGICSNAGDIEGLANNIEMMVHKSPEELLHMSRNALKYYKEHFNKEKLLEDMDQWFK